jgi:hypothetical protein
MRAKEFIVENDQMDSTMPSSDTALSGTISRSLPATYSIPKLPNSDFYKQYRFGVAIAAARSAKQRDTHPGPNMAPASAWGENEIVVAYALDTEIIDDALKTMGLEPGDKKLLSTKESEEAPDIGSKSPVSSFRGYGK